MGNSNTKESRDNPDGSDRRTASADPTAYLRDSNSRSRGNRMSRPDLTILGISSSSSRDRARDDAPFEHRETRQEREARRLERERAQRAKDRERSVREEHVDGGYLVTLGTYTGTEDFSKPVVRQLQIERKLAPFWRGLNDFSESWAEHQIVAAARGLPVPAADAPPDPELMPRPPPADQSVNNLTVPMGPRTLSAASDRSGSGAGSGLPSPASPAAGKGGPFKPRAKALAAALSVGSRNTSSTDLAPKEINMPHDPFVNGQPIEVFLYKDACECPICFLSYPPYLNRTRCCDQPICTECFVQIKRAEPHLPEHHPDGQARDPNEGLNPGDSPEMLISEPSACPYCQQPEFGVTYDPPPFRRGLAYGSTLASSTAMSSQSSLHSTLPPNSPPAGRRRTHSLSANAPNVITTDRVRPDWATKLHAARAHQARRAAAATALHTAAFLVGGTEPRSMLRPGRFSRRNTGSNTVTIDVQGSGASDTPDGTELGTGSITRNPDGSRRSRMEELEEMMFMEAVRLSLAAEEERKRKEEKALRKEAKKREKEERKAMKKQGKDPYGGHTSGASGSSLSLGLGRRRGNSAASNLRMEATVQGASQVTRGEDSPGFERGDTAESAGDKGKGIDRGQHDSAAEGSSPAGSLPIPTASRGGSHLRQMSNASSLGSSLADTPAGSYNAGYGGPEGSGAGGNGAARSDDDAEPMFNFRSLAEMVGVNIDDGSAQRTGAEEGESPAGSTQPRPLSQVKEDDMEAEAEHHEETFTTTKVTLSQESTKVADDKALDGGNATPELKITPEASTTSDELKTVDKRIAGASVTTQPTQTI